MSGFIPAVPSGGLAGWAFLSRTAETQKSALASSTIQTREADYFRQKIGSVRTAEALVSDRRLLSVALTAFGLEADLPNRFFIQKVLESPPTDSDALAFKLADPRYGDLAKTFGFGSMFGPATGRPGFADRVLSAYQTRSFEAAVGTQSTDLRLMLGLERELGSVLSQKTGGDSRWFAVMGTPPLRAVFESALGLPQSFGALDLDRQLEDFKQRSEARFGTSDLADFLQPERLEDLRRQYLLRSDEAAGLPTSPALQLLSGSNGGGSSILAALYPS